MSCYYFYRTLLDLNDKNASLQMLREIYDRDSDMCNKKYFKDRIEAQLKETEIKDVLNYRISPTPIHMKAIRKSKLHITAAIFFYSPISVKTYMLCVYPVDKIINFCHKI